MKKTNKLIISGLGLVLGSLALSGCTKSFCNVDDQAHIMYMFDYGVTQYYDSAAEDRSQLFTENNNIFVKYTELNSMPEKSGIYIANKKAEETGAPIPSLGFWKALDEVVLDKALEKSSLNKSTVTYSELFQSLNDYGYLKFTTTEEKGKAFDNFESYVKEAATKVGVDDCPTEDYLKDYKDGLSATIQTYRSCLAIEENQYGYYGYDSGIDGFRPNPASVTISKKTWGGAWKQGLFQGLLIYPIGWVLESFIGLFSGHDIANLQNGVPQVLALLLVTFIVRGLVLALTFKSTTATSKMQLLQPEITKIQQKYPNSNTSMNEKQRMAMEMQALYKKHHINPLASLLTTFIQFPIFMCVWGAIQGSASLSTGSLLGLNLSSSISTTIFNSANWANGSAITALVLFLLMAAGQVMQMLLPRILQKKKTKNIAKLGKNPAMKAQQNKTMMFTIIMMGMIIIMGFTLVSAMGVYWLVGSIFSLVQTLITFAIGNRKKKN